MPGRRRFLRTLGGTAGAAAAGQLTLLPGCSGGRIDPEAISRIPLERVAPGQRIKIRHSGFPVELHRTAEGVVATVMMCTHERCEMIWLDWADAYHCPCHGARFTADRQPESGPVNEPLQTLPARIEGGTIVVGGAPRS